MNGFPQEYDPTRIPAPVPAPVPAPIPAPYPGSGLLGFLPLNDGEKSDLYFILADARLAKLKSLEKLVSESPSYAKLVEKEIATIFAMLLKLDYMEMFDGSR